MRFGAGAGRVRLEPERQSEKPGYQREARHQTPSASPLPLGAESGDRTCFYVLIIYSAQSKVVFKQPNDSGVIESKGKVIRALLGEFLIDSSRVYS